MRTPLIFDRARAAGSAGAPVVPRAVLTLVLATLACSDVPVAPPLLPEPVPPPAKVLGVVQMRVTVTGSGGVRTSTSFFPAGSFRSSGARFTLSEPAQEGGAIGPLFEMLPGAGSFTYGTPGAGGYRYVFASAKVRNAGETTTTPPDTIAFTTPKRNLSMIAIEVPEGGGFDGIPGTPFSGLTKFNGTAADPAIAEGIVPTGAVKDPLGGPITTHSPDALQVFTEAEAALASSDFAVFPYGYMIHHVSETNTRTLAANPGPNQYDGIITLGLKIPLQPNPADDVYGFSMFFVLREDTETRITQSIEEQDAAGQAAFEAKVASLAGGPDGLDGITILPGGSYGGSISAPVRKLCAVRIAGTPTSPTAWLDGSAAATCPTLTAVSPSSGLQNNTVGVTLTGTNFVNGSTTVTVSGSGVTVTNLVFNSATELTADFVIASGATPGARTVTVTTASGTSGGQTFQVNSALAPTLTSVTPNSGKVGELVSVTLTGTNFISGATVNVSGSNVQVLNVNVANSAMITADFGINPTAATGARTVTVTTSEGTSAAVPFTVNP